MSIVPPLGRSSSRWRLGAIIVTAVLAGCGGPSANSVPAGPSGTASASASTAAPTLPQITASPPDNAKNVRLDAPVAVSASSGALISATVTDDVGSPVPGSLTPDGTRWMASGTLSSSRTYVIQADAAGTGGTTSLRSVFATLRATPLGVTVTPTEGDVVGVGMPLILTFDHPVQEAQQVAFLEHVVVNASVPVKGAWHWWSLHEVRYRPETYWPAGAVVTVVADLRSADAGGGVWGASQVHRQFTIGEKHTTVIDNAAHTMTVSVADQVKYTWPASMGKPGFETIGGTLWVRYKLEKLRMQSCGTFGGAACVPGNANFYDQDVFWDTAVSTDGYFIHAAPWSVASQGNANVSHGCINLSPERAQTFFEMSSPGDIVQVINSPKAGDESDGEGDWQIPFAQYANSGPARP